MEESRLYREKRVIMIWLAILIAGIASGVWGAQLPPEMRGAQGEKKIPQALRAPVTEVWKAKPATLKIPIGKEPQSCDLTFSCPPIPEGKLVVLRFRVRMASRGFGGWNHYLGIQINGKPVKFFTREGTSRLLNRRGRSVRTTYDKEPQVPYWGSVSGQQGLLTVFGPDWDSLEPRFITARQELYWYLLDVSDLVKEGDNHLRLTNLAVSKFFHRTAEECRQNPMLIDSLSVGFLDESARDNLLENLAAGMKQFEPVAKITGKDIRVEAGTGGALRITWQGDSYYVRSEFSAPGDRIQWNRLWWTPQDGVTVQSAVDAGGRLVITLTSSAYTLRRVIRLDLPFIRVEDTFRNQGPSDVGIMMHHDLIPAHRAAEWWISGLKHKPVHTVTAYNPTLFLSGEKTGMGIAVIDSVIRSQMVSSGGRNKVTFGTDHYGIPQGKEYTATWSLYAGDPDYWNFLNAVRRDWHVNHTIPGMWGFWYFDDDAVAKLNSDPDKMRAFLNRKRIDLFGIAPWFEYYYKPKYWKPRSVYKKSVQEQMKQIKAVKPDARVLACLESFLYYAPESFFKGTLPKFWTEKHGVLEKRGPHSFDLGEKGTQVVDATPWRDSVFRLANGHVDIDLHYATRYEDGGVNLKVYPTLDNYWQKKFLDMEDYCTKTCGLDGVYIDSFSYYYSRSYDRWDGHSVNVDPVTGKIKQKYAQLGLITRFARRQWVKHVTDQGKIVVTNGKPATAELQDLPQISFLEAEWAFDPFKNPLYAPRVAQAQLSTPMALGVRAWRYKGYETKYAEIIQRAVIAYLRYGALYCHYVTDIPEPGQPGGGGYGILNHEFPFTPVELHEGWVVGKERILTAVSGEFDWPHKEKPNCLRFDIRGMPVAGGFTLRPVPGGWHVSLKLDDWNETAVIEQATQDVSK